MRRITGALIGAVAGTLVAGALSAETLTMGVQNETTSLDPHFRNNWINLSVADHIFDTLSKQGPNAELLPGLAESWQVIDPQTVRLSLRKNVKWHDGSPFTADDVIFTVERVQAGIPGATVPMDRYFLQGGKEYKKIDDFTVEIKTTAPYPLTVDDLSIAHIISRKHAAGLKPDDYNAGKGMIGTGPYKFVEFRQGESLTVAANPDFWGGKPNWTKVVMKPITNPSARVAALLNGSVDLIDNVPTTDVASLEKNPKVSVTSGPSRRAVLLAGDHTRLRSPNVKTMSGEVMTPNPLRDWRVRKAIDMAINRDAIVERIMDKQAIPAGQIVFPGAPGHHPDLKPTKYDPEGAKKLLQQAGYGEGFQLVINTPPARYGNDVKLSEAVAQMLSAVGIKTTVEVVPEAAYTSRQGNGTHSFSLASLGSVNSDPGSLITSLHTFNPKEALGIANWGRYGNRDFDVLAAELNTEIDVKKRDQLMKNAMAIAAEDVAAWILHWPKAVWASRADIAVVSRSDQWTLAQSAKKK